jgi:aminoglycoside 2'-N-acetyltransferase I
VVSVTRAHSADVAWDDLVAVRQLLDDSFDDPFGDEDWEHTLGGIHVLVHEHGELVGHVAVVQRRLLHRDLAIRTGYVEGLAVRRDRRRRGHAGTAMNAAERVIRAAYDLGALSDGTGIEGFYERRGWMRWRGPTCVLAPTGMRRTEDDDGGILVLTTPTSPELDTSEGIACDWRAGDVW